MDYPRETLLRARARRNERTPAPRPVPAPMPVPDGTSDARRDPAARAETPIPEAPPRGMEPRPTPPGGGHALYRELMKSHDRVGTRHLK